MNEDFELELKATFLDEALDLITQIEQCFLTLEEQPNDPATLERLFRIAHNLKGSSKAVGFDTLGHFTHELESYLLQVKQGELVGGPSINLLLDCADYIQRTVDMLREDPNAKLDGSHLIQAMHDAMARTEADLEASAPSQAHEVEDHQSFHAAPPAADDPGFGMFETAAVVVEEKAPEMSHATTLATRAADTNEEKASQVNHVAPNLVTPPSSSDVQAVAASSETNTSKNGPHGKTNENVDESIRVSLARVDKLINFVGEMVILQSVLQEQMPNIQQSLVRKTIHQLGKVSKEIQDISMGLRMVPLKQTFQKMQRIVRDTSASLGKKVVLSVNGEDTELDKTVLEHVSDPLVHLIRNAVDHGIEAADARRANGKDPTGHVNLNAFNESGFLVIEVTDDGAGLDAEKLKRKAFEKGILKDPKGLADREAYNLIFHPGFSTKAVVTDVSGRGVGMDVVKTNIEKLQGDISLDTQLGKGTKFRMRLPLSLSIIDAMIIQLDQERYVIPLNHMHESLRPNPSDIHFATNVGEVLNLRGENVPIYHLAQLLHKSGKPKSLQESIIIVVRSLEKPFAVAVDDILGQGQVVIKKLGEELRNLQGISGSAILGDGRPALILELPELASYYSQKRKPSQELRRVA